MKPTKGEWAYFHSGDMKSPNLFDMGEGRRYFTAFWVTSFGGVRLVCGEFGSMTYEVDLCCGDDYENILNARALYELKIKKNIEMGLTPSFGLKTGSDPKPYPKDPKFVEFLNDLTEELRIDSQIESVT